MSYENILLKCLTERVRLNDPFHENMSCWGMRGNRINRGEGQPGRPPTHGTEEGMEADDLLCSRNARSRTPLVGRAQSRIDQAAL